MPVTRWTDELRDDVRFAARQLRRSPAFALVAVTTLALGIGANSAIFALVDAALLRPLPYREPERLVMLWERNERSPRASVAPLNLLDWKDRGRTLEQVGGYVPRVGGMVMAGESGIADTVSRQWVTFGIFDVLGVEPILGRTFQPEDDLQQKNAVVLGEAFWRTRFGADPGIVGRDLRLDGEPYTVVGVVPKEFQLVGPTSLWALASFERTPENRRARGFAAVGRLRPGATIEAARGDVASVAQLLAREFPETNAGRGVTIEPLQQALVGRELRLTSLLFLGVVGFVLLICCANVANLTLARATVRSRELAIRSALGAGQGRVMRQLLTESLLLSALGGLVGLAVGAAILRATPSLVPEGLLPAAVRPELDARVAAFCAFVALLVGLVFGAAPGWKASRQPAARVIAAQGRTTTGRGGRTRAALVVAEVATAVVVLFGAGLLLRTLLAVEGVDRGYRAREVLTMVVDPIGSRYPTPAAMRQFYDAVEHEVRTVPGVRGVAWATTLPFGPSYVGRTTFELAGEPLEPAKRPSADYQIVSPSYFETVELPLVAGRNFDARDHDAAVPVCIVNEAFVKSQLEGRPPIGARVALPTGPRPQDPLLVREIVGVARQVKGRPDEAEDMLQLYVPITQHVIDDVFLVVRPASGRAEAYAAEVRAAIGRVDREQLVSVRGVTTLEEIASGATSRHRFRAVMVTTFAALALVLAMVGVFGILAYSVQQRVRDFAVRRALGATSADVVRLVTASALRVVAAGVVIGLVLSAALGRLLKALLFGVQPLDPATFALVTVLLLAGAALSTAGPALRAARVEPAVALRDE
jgi:putative ABC transport system permease protein